MRGPASAGACEGGGRGGTPCAYCTPAAQFYFFDLSMKKIIF